MNIMRSFIVLAFFVFLFNSCSQSDSETKTNFSIKGEVSNVNDKWLYLKKISEGGLKTVDSVLVKDGSFNISGYTEAAELFLLAPKESRQMFRIFVTKGDLTLKGDIEKPMETEVTGSKEHDLFMTFFKSIDSKFSERSRKLSAKYYEAKSNKDNATMAEAMAENEKLMEERKNFIIDFVRKNNTSSVAAYLCLFELANYLKFEEIQELKNGLSGEAVKTPYFKELDSKLKVIENVQIGKVAPDFKLTNPDGKEIELKSFRGKYLLIDFWASWCRPCRMENPNVVKVYKQYKDKGLEILGVSLDNEKSKWVEAIEKDGISWAQVSDLKGWRSDVAKLYGVQSIPQTVLLDKDGKIIAKNLRGEELSKKMAELMP